MSVYRHLWARYSKFFEHYFETLIHIAEYIDDGTAITNEKEKTVPNIRYQFYSTLFLLQLSRGEKEALIINIIGSKNPNIFNLFQKLGLFDNSPIWLQPIIDQSSK